jgi:hypothetical protein
MVKLQGGDMNTSFDDPRRGLSAAQMHMIADRLGVPLAAIELSSDPDPQSLLVALGGLEHLAVRERVLDLLEALAKPDSQQSSLGAGSVPRQKAS